MLRIWLYTFAFSIVVFMAAYVTRIGLLATLPTLLVMALVSYTFLRILKRTGGDISRKIAPLFFGAAILMILFFLKQVLFFGSDGASLALKIMLYLATFMSALLIGFYEDELTPDRSILFASVLFGLPLVFFILFAQGNAPSTVLSVFNRNSFAGYTITASVMLLGFGFKETDRSLVFYFGCVAVALIINTTMGALLAFTVAMVAYVGPRALWSPRIAMGVIGAASLAVVFFFIAVPDAQALTNIEAFNRLNFVYGAFSNLFRFYDGTWLELDMATAVRFAPTGELDMSAIFRLLHWTNIFLVLSEEGLGTMLLGGGTDWIEVNKPSFTYSLAAHNEYVRLTVEQGLIFGTMLILAVWFVVLPLRGNVLFVPLFAMTLYFATENLLNNFVTTSMFFFALGVTAARAKRDQ